MNRDVLALPIVILLSSACEQAKEPAAAPTPSPTTPSVEAAPAQGSAVSREALVHFCSSMASLRPETFASLPPEEQQDTVMKRIRDTAHEKGIQDWDAFEATLSTMDPLQKQPYMKRLVKEHDAAEECKVFL